MKFLVYGTILLLAMALSDEHVEAKEMVWKEVVWEGYLFQNDRGQIGVGDAIIAMGTMAQAARLLGGDLGNRLTPLVSEVRGGLFFWNYEWYGSDRRIPTSDVRNVPRILVQVRGEVMQEQEDPSSGSFRPFGSLNPMTMTHGQLLTVEFLSEEWLVTWRKLMKLGFNPWWRERVAEGDGTKERKLAPKVLVLLMDMQRQSQITAAQQEATKRVDSHAKVVKHFQAEMEVAAYRWLVEMNNRYQLNLLDLDALGPLPPTPEIIQQWFLSAANKADFLKQVQSTWPGELDDLVLSYWHQEPNQGWLASIRLNELSEWWSNKDFLRFQRSTKAQRADVSRR